MKTKFDVYDYLIFVFVLLISIGIGLYFGFNLNEKVKKFFKNVLFKKNAQITPEKTDNGVDLQKIEKNDPADQQKMEKTTSSDSNNNNANNKTSEYLTGNHSMSAFPIALSLLATFFSSSSLLGFPAEVYQYGIQYWMIVFGVCLVPLIGGIY